MSQQTTAPTIKNLLKASEQQLKNRQEAEQLLLHVLKQNRAYLYTWPEQTLNAAQMQQFQNLVKQRLAGTPVAYLIGSQGFYDLNFRVTPATLIPRPETELLIDILLAQYTLEKPMQLCELGTGSGAISVTLAKHRSTWQITATDICEQALEVAQANAGDHQINNIRFVQSDWFAQLPAQTFDIIVSNPPYIAQSDPHLTQGDLRFEPQHALVAGVDGLAAYKQIISHAKAYLKPEGMLIFEHGYQQAQPLHTLLEEHGYQGITTHKDLAAHPRITLAFRD